MNQHYSAGVYIDFTGGSSIERRHGSLLKAGRSMPFWGKNAIPLSLFPFPHPFALPMRLAAAWQILSLGFALALLILSVPNASAQQITSHNSKEDFNTLGVAGGNKGPQGLWSDGTTMLVSDVDGKIYSYDLETKQRQDSHHNDRRVGTPAAAEEGVNTDDFILYKDGSTTETIRPYGLWATNSTLWVGSTEGSRTNKTAKLYAYTMTWNTGKDVRTDLDGEERYLKGTRDSTKDINLHRQTDSLPDLDANGNPIVYEEFVNNGTTNRTLLTYGSVTNIISGETNIVYHLLNKDRNRLTRNSEGKLTTLDGVVYENANISFQTNMVTGPVGNLSPTGIWSDGTTIWVADQGDYIEFVSDGKNERFFSPDKIYAYNLWTNAMGEIWTSDMGESAKIFDGSLNTNKVIQLSSYGIHRQHDDDKNTYAQGLWSDGDTMWVANTRGAADDDEKRIYAYNVTTKLRDPDKDFKTLSEAGNDRPRGIWSDGTTMWVADQTDNKLYAYHAFSQFASRNDKQDFKDDENRSTLIAAGNNKPRGIWSDDETLWVADAAKGKLFAYNLATKERDSAKDFNTLDAENDHPTGVWANETTMWVADWNDDKLYAYKMADKTRDVDNDFNTLAAAGNNQPIGIWSDGTAMWVADTEDDKVYAYKMSDESRDSTKDINVKALIGNNYDPYTEGIWSDGTTMWVADRKGENSKIHAFTLPATGMSSTRDEAKDFDKLKDAKNHDPRGLWSDGVTMWVADSEKDQIFAYRLSDKAVLVELELTWRNLLTRRHESEDFEVHLNPPFLRGTTRYEASIPYSTTNLTLSTTTLRPTDIESVSLHSKTNLLQDPDSTTPGFQINNLAVGTNLVSITVTNTLANTNILPRTRTYEVNVNREFFTYNDPTKDMDLNLTSTNSTIQGIWANETTIWAVDSGRVYQVIENGRTNQYKKILAYDRKTKRRIESQDFDLNSINVDPRGIWSDDTTMWVVNSDDNKLYAYNMWTNSPTDGRMFDGSLDSSKDFDTLQSAGNTNPKWIWSDGVTMWVTDGDKNKIFAYKMSDKTRDESKEYDFNASDQNIKGIWADGETLWAANSEDSKIYAYKLADTDCREEGKEFNTLTLAGNNNPAGIYSDGTTMWVVDSETKKLHAYNQPLSGNASLKSLKLSDVYYLYDEGNAAKPFSDYFSSVTNSYPDAYVIYTNLSPTITPEAQEANAFIEIQPVDADSDAPGHQVSLSIGDNNPIKIIVTAANGNIKEYTVNIKRENGGRTPHKEFDLAENDSDSMKDNSDPVGLWSNGTNMWVLDEADKKFYVYKIGKVEYGERNNDKGFALDMDNSAPHGIWSNRTNMWVADSGDDKLYAYDLVTTNRVDPNDIGTLDSYNRSPTGIWSNDTTMWVADNGLGPDSINRGLYAYKLNLGEGETNRRDNPTDNPTKAKDIKLINNSAPRGLWSDGTTMWVLERKTSPDRSQLFAYTISTRTPDPSRHLNLPEENARPWGIWSDGATIWVTDSEDDKLYAYNLPQPPPPPPSDVGDESDDSEDSTLKDLRLSGIGLNPVFSPDNTIYTALVDHDVASTTVTATPNDSEATVNIFWGGRGTTRITAGKGTQVSLKEGYNVIAIDVTAENGDVQTYLVRVTKSEAPPISGGPLPQNFQPSAVGGNPSASANSSSGGGWRSRLISAETLPGGGVRFVFLVVSAEEFRLETSSSLISGNWRLLPDGEFKVLRDNGDSQDRLTIILPQAEQKQRFLRLTPQR